MNRIFRFKLTPIPTKLTPCTGQTEPSRNVKPGIYWVLFFAGAGFAAVCFGKYFGLEQSALSIMAFIIYLVAVSLLVFLPVLLVANRITNEKITLLKKLENREMDEIRNYMSSSGELPSLEDYSIIYGRFEAISILPFSSRSMTILTL